MVVVEELVIHRLEDLTPHVDAMVELYDRAFREPPYNHTSIAADGFRGILPTHAACPDFEARLLLDGDRLVGFVYGHTNRDDQWWYRQIAPHLGQARRRRVFDDAWVIVELAVDPDARRRGFGRHLLHATMAGKPNRSAVLSTVAADSAATRLYAAEGFTALVPVFAFPGAAGTWTVLARPIDA